MADTLSRLFQVTDDIAHRQQVLPAASSEQTTEERLMAAFEQQPQSQPPRSPSPGQSMPPRPGPSPSPWLRPPESFTPAGGPGQEQPENDGSFTVPIDSDAFNEPLEAVGITNPSFFGHMTRAGSDDWKSRREIFSDILEKGEQSKYAAHYPGLIAPIADFRDDNSTLKDPDAPTGDRFFAGYRIIRFFDESGLGDATSKTKPFFNWIPGLKGNIQTPLAAASIKALRRITKDGGRPIDYVTAATFLREGEKTSERGWGAQVASVVLDMPGYMGAMSATKGVAKVGQKKGMNLFRKYLGGIVKGKVKKYATKGAGALVGTAARVATGVTVPEIAGHVTRKMAGQPEFELDENQELQLEQNAQSFWSALPAGVALSYTEMLGEVSGGAINKGASWLAKNLGAPAAKAVMPESAKKAVTGLQKAIYSRWLKSNKGKSFKSFMTFFEQNFGYHGPAGEMGEERFTEIMQGLLPGEDFGVTGQLAKGEIGDALYQLSVEGAAFSVPMAGMAAANAPGFYKEGKQLEQNLADSKEYRGERQARRQDRFDKADSITAEDAFAAKWIREVGRKEAQELAMGKASRTEFKKFGLGGIGNADGRKAFQKKVRELLNSPIDFESVDKQHDQIDEGTPPSPSPVGEQLTPGEKTRVRAGYTVVDEAIDAANIDNPSPPSAATAPPVAEAEPAIPTTGKYTAERDAHFAAKKAEATAKRAEAMAKRAEAAGLKKSKYTVEREAAGTPKPWVAGEPRKPLSEQGYEETPDLTTKGYRGVDRPQAPRPPGLREYSGWKLHLSVSEENQDAVDEWIWNNSPGGYKRGMGGGTNEGKDFTIYIGSRKDIDEFAAKLESEIGDLLDAPVGDSLHTNIPLGEKVTGRFDADGDDSFAPYGGKGLPFTERDMMRIAVARSRPGGVSDELLAEVKEHAERLLRKRYPGFFETLDETSQTERQPDVSSPPRLSPPPPPPARTRPLKKPVGSPKDPPVSKKRVAKRAKRRVKPYGQLEYVDPITGEITLRDVYLPAGRRAKEKGGDRPAAEGQARSASRGTASPGTADARMFLLDYPHEDLGGVWVSRSELLAMSEKSEKDQMVGKPAAFLVKDGKKVPLFPVQADTEGPLPLDAGPPRSMMDAPPTVAGYRIGSATGEYMPAARYEQLKKQGNIKEARFKGLPALRVSELREGKKRIPTGELEITQSETGGAKPKGVKVSRKKAKGDKKKVRTSRTTRPAKRTYYDPKQLQEKRDESLPPERKRTISKITEKSRPAQVSPDWTGLEVDLDNGKSGRVIDDSGANVIVETDDGNTLTVSRDKVATIYDASPPKGTGRPLPQPQPRQYKGEKKRGGVRVSPRDDKQGPWKSIEEEEGPVDPMDQKKHTVQPSKDDFVWFQSTDGYKGGFKGYGKIEEVVQERESPVGPVTYVYKIRLYDASEDGPAVPVGEPIEISENQISKWIIDTESVTSAKEKPQDKLEGPKESNLPKIEGEKKSTRPRIKGPPPPPPRIGQTEKKQPRKQLPGKDQLPGGPTVYGGANPLTIVGVTQAPKQANAVILTVEEGDITADDLSAILRSPEGYEIKPIGSGSMKSKGAKNRFLIKVPNYTELEDLVTRLGGVRLPSEKSPVTIDADPKQKEASEDQTKATMEWWDTLSPVEKDVFTAAGLGPADFVKGDAFIPFAEAALENQDVIDAVSAGNKRKEDISANPPMLWEFENSTVVGAIDLWESRKKSRKGWGKLVSISPLKKDTRYADGVIVAQKDSSPANVRMEQRNWMKEQLPVADKPLVNLAKKSTKQAFLSEVADNQKHAGVAKVVRDKLGMSLEEFWQYATASKLTPEFQARLEGKPTEKPKAAVKKKGIQPPPKKTVEKPTEKPKAKKKVAKTSGTFAETMILVEDSPSVPRVKGGESNSALTNTPVKYTVVDAIDSPGPPAVDERNNDREVFTDGRFMVYKDLVPPAAVARQERVNKENPTSRKKEVKAGSAFDEHTKGELRPLSFVAYENKRASKGESKKKDKDGNLVTQDVILTDGRRIAHISGKLYRFFKDAGFTFSTSGRNMSSGKGVVLLKDGEIAGVIMPFVGDKAKTLAGLKKQYPDSLRERKEAAVKAPQTSRDLLEQFKEAGLNGHEAAALEALVAARAEAMGMTADEFTRQFFGGVIRSEMESVGDYFQRMVFPTVRSRNVKGVRQRFPDKSETEVNEWLNEEADESWSDYADSNYDDMDSYLDSCLEFLRRIERDSSKETIVDGKAVRKSALRRNSKTLFSVDFTSECPWKAKGRACLYCYVYGPQAYSEISEAKGVRQPTKGVGSFDSAEYNGEILEMPDALVQFINERHGGLRVFSLGDFRQKDWPLLRQVIRDARQKGLKLKVITKGFGTIAPDGDVVRKIEAYLTRNGWDHVSYNLSTDFADMSVFAEGDADFLSTLETFRPFLSNTVTPADAASYRRKRSKNARKRIKIRYVALDKKDAILAVMNPDVDVVTLYHGYTDPKKLVAIWKKINPELFKVAEKAVKEQKGQEWIVSRLARMFEARKDAVAMFTGKNARVTQKDLDEAFGDNSPTVEEFTEEGLKKTCCITRMCSTCPNCCGVQKGADGLNILSQLIDGHPLASVEFQADGRAIIRAFDQTNVSSMAHELGHVFRRTLEPDLMAAAEKWAGVQDVPVEDGGQWTVEAEEKFATAFERYLRDGKAPTTGLRKVFEQFKEWLRKIYKVLKGTPLEKKLDSEIRQVFDAMLTPKKGLKNESAPKAEAESKADAPPKKGLKKESMPTPAEIEARANEVRRKRKKDDADKARAEAKPAQRGSENESPAVERKRREILDKARKKRAAADRIRAAAANSDKGDGKVEDSATANSLDDEAEKLEGQDPSDLPPIIDADGWMGLPEGVDLKKYFAKLGLRKGEYELSNDYKKWRPVRGKKPKHAVGIVADSLPEDLEDLAGAAKAAAEKAWMSWGRKFVRKLTRPEGNAPKEVHKKVEESRLYLNSVGREIRHAMADLKRAVKDVWGSSIQDLPVHRVKALNDALHGRGPALPQSIQDAVDAARDHVDVMSARLAASGVLDGKDDLKATIAENMGLYITRSYRIFDDPNHYKKVPAHVLAAAKSQLAALNPGATAEQLDGYIEYLLRGWEGLDPVSAYGKLGVKDLGIIQAKKEIPVWLRELWGEYSDPVVNYTRSVARLASLVVNHEMLRDLSEMSEYFTKGEILHGKLAPTVMGAGKGHTIVLTSKDSETMAPLNGYTTSPEVAEALDEMLNPVRYEGFSRIYRKILGLAKWQKTVGSVMTHERNFLGNAGFAWMNGHWDLRNFGDAAKIAWGDIMDKDGEVDWLGGKEELREVIKEFARLGILDESVTLGEVQDSLSEAWDMRTSDLAESQLEKWVLKTKESADKAYQAEDAVWKIFAFSEEYNRYRAAYPQSVKTNEEIKELAAENIRNTYPTYSKIPPWIKSLRRNIIVAPFVSFPAEVVRTTANWVKLIKSEIKDQYLRPIAIRRMVGGATYAAIPTAASVMSAIIMGIDPDEEDSLRTFLPPWARNSLLAHFGGEGLTKNVIDLGYIDPHSYIRAPVARLFEGAKEGDIANATVEAVAEAFSPITNLELVTKALHEVWDNSKNDSRSAIYNTESHFFAKAAKSAAHVGKTVVPGTLTSVNRVRKGVMGEIDETGRAYDPVHEFVAMTTGFRFWPVNVEQGLYFRGMYLKERWRNATRIITSKAGAKGVVSRENLDAAYRDAEDSRLEVFEEANAVVWDAYKLGMRPDEIITQLRAGGWTKGDAQRLFTGEYIPYYPSSHVLERAAMSKDGSARGRDVLRKSIVERPTRVRSAKVYPGISAYKQREWKTFSSDADRIKESLFWLQNYPVN